MTQPNELDLGPLTWVKSEIDLALARADESLEQAATAPDPAARVQFAQTHLHQARGALSIVGLDGLTQFASALDQMLGNLARSDNPSDPTALTLARRSVAAIGNYLEELVHGTPDQPLRLFGLYAELAAARSLPPASPADLFYPDLSLRPPRRRMPALDEATRASRLRNHRTGFERGLLQWLRAPGDAGGPQAMGAAVAGIEQLQTSPQLAALWWAAQALFEALASGDLSDQPEIKRLCSGLHAQIRRLGEGSAAAPDRLMRELLYWVSQAPMRSDLQRAVRTTWHLDALLPEAGATVSETPLAPLLKSLQGLITSTKFEWDEFCGGQAAALSRFDAQLGEFATQSALLGRPALDRLVDALGEFVRWLRKDPLRFNSGMAIEMATALLLAEAALDRGVPDSAFAEQASDTSGRLQALMRGEALQAAEGSPTVEVARRAQEREALVQVSREILSSLAQVEQTLDDYFRNQQKRAPLATLDKPLKQIAGALALIGDQQAIDLVHDAAATVARFAEATESPPQDEFEALAQRLSALGFYVEALQHGRADLQRFLKPGTAEAQPEPLPESGESEAAPLELMAAMEVEAHPEPVGEPTAEAAAAEEPAHEEHHELIASVDELHDTHGFEPEAPPVPVAVPEPAPETQKLLSASAEEIDAELLAIFIEEAHDVLATIGEELELSRTNPGGGHLTAIRRGFHTLKGSGRMVGLRELGEAAWGVEQTLNRWLQLEWTPTAALHHFIDAGHQVFTEWVGQLEAGGSPVRDAAALMAEAERLRSGETPIDEPAAAESAPAAPATPAAEPSPDMVETSLEFGELDLADDGTVLPVARAADEPFLPEETSLDEMLLSEELEPLELDEAEPFAPLSVMADEAAPAQEIESLDDAPPIEEIEALEPTEEMEALDAIQFVETPEPLEAFEPVEELEPLELLEPSSEPATTALPEEASLEAPPGEIEETFAAFDFGDLPTAPEPAAETATVGAEPEAVLEEEPKPVFELESVPDTEAELETEAEAGTGPEIALELEAEAEAEPEIALEPAAEAETEPEIALESEAEAETEPEIALESEAEAEPEPEIALESEAEAEPELESAVPVSDVIAIGDTEISRPLFDLYCNEARHHLSVLHGELARLQANPTLVPPEPAVRAAHTLAGISGTARVMSVHALARALEHGLDRLRDNALAPSADQSALLLLVRDTLEAMLAEVEACRMPLEVPELVEQLDALGRERRYELAVEPVAETPAAAESVPSVEASTHEPAPPVHDDLDEQLLPIFLEEGTELVSELHGALRAWRSDPDSADHPKACARLLHTLKGSARMAGAMSLGQHVHHLESSLEASRMGGRPAAELIEELESGLDQAEQMMHVLASGEEPAAEPFETPAAAEAAAPAPAAPVAIEPTPGEMEAGLGGGTLRVRAEAIDRFVNEAGEIGIARSRIEGELRTLRRSLLDLTENVIRLRNQLREVEIQAEVQMQSRIAQAESHHTEFDPLEMDRYTRLQELTRMMAESVGDVTTVQQSLLRNLDGADLALNSQARLSRDLQQALMQVRMVPFDSLADRLYRVVRQTAKELGKRANLDLRGGRIEIDRSVLEHMTAPLEHLLRNAVAHGIEPAADRLAAGKDEIGQLTLSVSQEGNEIAISLADDGRGLDYGRIAERAREKGLLGADEAADERRLTNLIFVPGFSTAGSLSSVSGRGVGMDVVKSETAAVGGRIDVHSLPGKGTEFRIHLPLTLAVTQAVLVRAGSRSYAIPSNMIAQVMELRAEPMQQLREAGGTEWQGEHYPYRYLSQLLGERDAQPELQRFNWVLLLRAGAQTLALHVDGLRGNQEIVVKNAGPQLVRIVGVSGATVLGDGEIVLILNPVALASRSLAEPEARSAAPVPTEQAAPAHQPTVMVVDDSLTVRKITGRLLEREGYRVITAKDGVDALEALLETIPDVILSDIEMPRMDGFDLVRNIRADERLRRIPVIMITSRLADKHREYAMRIGADHYLGKPYDEAELLGLLRSYAANEANEANEATV